ncbi:hypothetical protein ABW20_dc0102061 [Dactylellina cionopaga]|nr:hypothetical protein ABW20_dc0102061 [Dactylellina cionopaga]
MAQGSSATHISPFISFGVGLLLLFDRHAAAQNVNCNAQPLVIPHGNVTVRRGIQSYGLSVALGIQNFAFRPYTDGDEIFVVETSKNCTSVTNQGTCTINGTLEESVHGGLFDVRPGTALGTYEGPTYNEVQNPGSSRVFNANETVNIPDPESSNGTLSFSDFGFQFILWEPGQFASIGLSSYSTLIRRLYSAGRIPSRIWGFFPGWIGASPTTSQSGALVLGGYDPSFVAGDFVEYDVDLSNRGRSEVCQLRIDVTDIIVKNTRTNEETRVSFEGETLRPCIDTRINHLGLPQNVYFRFLNAIGVIDSPDTPSDIGPYSALPLPLPNEQKYTEFNVIVRDTRKNLNIEIQNSQVIHQIRDFSPNGLFYRDTEDNQGLLLRLSTDPAADVSWGWPFLSAAYLLFNGENNTFALAPGVNRVVAENDRTPVPLKGEECGTTTNTNNGGNNNGNNNRTGTGDNGQQPNTTPSTSIAGPVAGGVVGGLAVGVLIAVAVWMWRRKKRQNSKLDKEELELPELPPPMQPPHEVDGGQQIHHASDHFYKPPVIEHQPLMELP